MKIDEAIERLEGRYMNVSMCGTSEEAKAENEAINMAIAALRAQQKAEKNAPLTWRELTQMVGQTVWIKETGQKALFTDYWAIVTYYDKDDKEIGLFHGEDPDDYGTEESYGDAWFAYRRPPEV